MEQERIVILETCYHCGNKGNLNIMASYQSNDFDCIEAAHYILSCPVCSGISFYETFYVNELMNNQRILYPNISFDEVGVPVNIINAFNSAIKVSKIDIAICALSLRRVLDLICANKNAQGNNLYEMTNDLISRNILPEGFDKALFLIRTLGNEGAHKEELCFEDYDINQLIKFVKSIINYLYIMPEEIKELEARTKLKKIVNLFGQ